MLSRTASARRAAARQTAPRQTSARRSAAQRSAALGAGPLRSALLAPVLMGAALLILVLLAVGLFVVPASAQILPAGWQLRADRPDAALEQVEVVDMPPGFHITTGPAVILWQDPSGGASAGASGTADGASYADMEASFATYAEGDYRIEAEYYLFDPGERREAFGFFVGGRDLTTDAQAYTYLLLRNGGEFIFKHRAGADAPTVLPWTAHPAIISYADRPEGEVSVRNELALERRGRELRLIVNGTEVARTDAANLPLDGIVGLRVNHGLNLHVTRFEVLPLEQ